MSAGTEPGRREVAHRVFATEYDEATFEYSQSEEERAPNYVVTPTGARINRLFFVGVLTEVEQVNEDVVRARIVDPTGAFVIYAGQYQPDELAFLERTDPPAFIAVTGKARTFEPDDGDRIYTSVRPESINEVDEGTRDRWVVQAAKHTLDRIATMATASTLDLGGEELADALGDRDVGKSLAAGIPLALEQYETGPTYLDALRRTALDAARVVAGERGEVRPPDVSPGATRADAPSHEVLAETGSGFFVELSEPGDTSPEASKDEAETGTEPEPDTGAQASVEAEPEPTTDSGETSPAETEARPEFDEEPEPETEAGGESLDEPEVEAETPKDIDEDPEAAGGTEIEADAESSPEGGESDAEKQGEEELGDFDGGTLSEDSRGEAAPATDDMYEFDEAERKEIEAEYGTEFETGTEVDEPGEADIESPSPDQDAEGAPDEAETQPEQASSVDAEADGDSETTETAGTDNEDSRSELVDSDADVDEAVIEAMRELDDGDGADREAVIDAVASGTGADRATIEDAIQEALMGGQCYEPDEGLLKPI
ncbi:MAG: RPA family protein [Natrialbaceae archaeon]|jgi:RPA family protein